MNDATKTCKRCGVSSPIPASGQWRCPPCRRATDRQWHYTAYHADIERSRMVIRDRQRAIYHADVEGSRTKAKEKKEKRLSNSAAERDHVTGAAWARATYALNPERFKQRDRQRQEWLKLGDVTRDQLKSIWARDNECCVYCGMHVPCPRFAPLSPRGFDHVVPMARGGHHTASNIAVCCRPCNTRKGLKDRP